MSPALRTWIRRPLFWIGGIVGGILGVFALYFLWQVGHAMWLIKTGNAPLVQDQKELSFEASVSRVFANSNVTNEDIARVEKGSNPTLGNPNAKIHIVEFLDWDCPYCKRAAPTVRAYLREHPDDVLLIIRDFPVAELHPEAERVAIAARCVFEQQNAERYWAYHDLLYSGPHAPTDLRAYAREIGANLGAYDSCVAAKKPLPEIAQSISDGRAAGVRGTPTFFFNGVKIQGAIDSESFARIIEVLKRQPQTP